MGRGSSGIWINVGWWQLQIDRNGVHKYRTDYFHVGAGRLP